MAAPLYVTQSGRLWHAGLILIVTVGLPGTSFSTSAHPGQDRTDIQPEERHIYLELLNDISDGWESKLAYTRLEIIDAKS